MPHLISDQFHQAALRGRRLRHGGGRPMSIRYDLDTDQGRDGLRRLARTAELIASDGSVQRDPTESEPARP